jgi:hypothetical protein
VTSIDVVAWYDPRHGSQGTGDAAKRLNVTQLVVSLLTMIAAYGVWFHPILPNDPVSGSGSSGRPEASSRSGPVSRSDAERAVGYALSRVGLPCTCDAAGLMVAAWGRGGKALDDFVGDQWNEMSERTSDNGYQPGVLRPGDLMFYGSYSHGVEYVTMYIGYDEMITVSGTDNVAKVSDIYAFLCSSICRTWSP